MFVYKRKDEAKSNYYKLVMEPIAHAVSDFMQDYYNFSAKIEFVPSKNNKFIGHIDLLDKKNKIYFQEDSSVIFVIKVLLHEITHIKQKVLGELYYDHTIGKLVWQKSELFDLDEYTQSGNKAHHDSFPWEAEAERNMGELFSKFINSKYLKNLEGLNPTLDFVIESI